MNLRKIEAESIRDFVQLAADEGYLSGRVLDYGCGMSPYRDVVEAAGGEYIGWDRVRFPANISGEDIGPIRLGHDSWDALLSTQTLQYVPDMPGLAAHFFRLLRPGGVLIVTGPTNWPEVEPEDLHRMTLAGARHLFEGAGFRIVKAEQRAVFHAVGASWSLGYGLSGIRSRSLIYALVDPETRLVRYVGKTTQCPVDRLRQHLAAARQNRSTGGRQPHLWNWLRSLREGSPSIRVLEADPDDIDKAERHWIGKLRGEGLKLCNMTNGGDGQQRGYSHSASELARRRAYRHSPETRAKITAANTGRKRSAEFRTKMSDIARQRPSVLTDADVRAIRTSTKKTRELAERFGVSQSYISQVRRGLARAHIT